MTNALQQRISSRTRLAAASAALMFVVVLVLVVGVVTTQSAQAQTFTVLYNFTGGADGAYPDAGLRRDKAGHFYGTTSAGGSSDGVVFKVNKSGKETVLHTFTGSDGSYPRGAVIRDAKGDLYGTAEAGGPSGYGTVWKVDTRGTETVLYNFTGGSSDGCYPYGGLLRDIAGNLYGTTSQCGTPNAGTVFKLSKTGKETVLHIFAGSDGASPILTTLLMDKKGNLYGVTDKGGASGYGTAYKLSKSGTLTVLHSFTGGTDGCYAFGTPAMDRNGNLLGTAQGCGSYGYGTVWKVTKSGTLTVLHTFTNKSADASFPVAGVIMDAKGNLYGDTTAGGAFGAGTVYELNKKGTLTLLHSFTGSDGSSPVGGVIRDAKGDLYGTAEAGGTYGYGTVWKLTP